MIENVKCENPDRNSVSATVDGFLTFGIRLDVPGRHRWQARRA